MIARKLPLLVALLCLCFGQQAMSQDSLTCDDIQWSSAVTVQYPKIDEACNAVMEKEGSLYARVTVEVQRVHNNVLTFKVLNRDGSSGGSYTQNVGTSWRAKIGGREYRARELNRGQRLNVYLPGDRWAIIHEGDDGPALEEIEVPAVAAATLPATASQWPLVGALGAGLLALGACLGLLRRRFATLN